MEKKFDFLFKLLLIGDSGVGKTCIIFRFVQNTFNPAFITTIGIDFKIRTVEIGKYQDFETVRTSGSTIDRGQKLEHSFSESSNFKPIF